MWFFKKKHNLVSSGILNGMFDHHSHLLWGVDDGSKTEEQTRQMILGLHSLGLCGGFVTPHIMAGLPSNTPSHLRTSFQQQLVPLCSELGFEIKLAAEYMLDEAFMAKLHHSEGVLSYDGKHLLIEMSHIAPPAALYDMIYEILVSGYIPVLAHPERYGFLKMEELEYLKERGCKFQLNLLSLSDSYQKGRGQRAFDLLESGLYDLVGTDAHTETMITNIGKINCKPKHIQTIEKLINHEAIL